MDSETSLKLMRYLKALQKTKLKQNFFANSEKEVGNFFQNWDHSESPLQIGLKELYGRLYLRCNIFTAAAM